MWVDGLMSLSPLCALLMGAVAGGTLEKVPGDIFIYVCRRSLDKTGLTHSTTYMIYSTCWCYVCVHTCIGQT